MRKVKTLETRLAEDHVQAEVSRGNRDPHPIADYPMDDWTVVLTLKDRRMPISWWTGFGVTGTPTARGVLARLLSDAGNVEGSPDFETWSARHRIDPADRTQSRLFQTRLRQTKTLRDFLGDRFESYLRDTAPEEELAWPNRAATTESN